MIDSDKVIEAVLEERAYQDNKWGTIAENRHTVSEWLTIMHNELSEAMQAWSKGPGTEGNVNALQEVVQVVAVGMACLEQHGLGDKRSQAESHESHDFEKEAELNRKAFGSTRSPDGRYPI